MCAAHGLRFDGSRLTSSDYSNVLYSSYMPILSSVVFDNQGLPYSVTNVLTSDFVFDQNAYHSYSRVFLPTTYILSYALQFAALPSLIVHTVCWHGKDILSQWRRSWNEAKFEFRKSKREGSRRLSLQSSQSSELSSRSGAGTADNLLSVEELMRAEISTRDDVPMAWYLLIGLSMTAIGIFVVELYANLTRVIPRPGWSVSSYQVHLPWYGLLLALGMCSALFVPIGIIQAITNQQSSIYLFSQLLCGVLFPGRPVANMIFVTYGYVSLRSSQIMSILNNV